ncbi:Uncharacterized protein PECH_002938 [Penicillium ucsense]|uniref:Uncharacterized protein n=1 Tax=Penicillium ucsense TaxID=2839758 RepID=A0A8J8W675_9EURO|nr:Uncharacterized protein PECM_003949 [Penicillium ucsense]KAF7737762.1 Uncharacterized protein PECH_002938 [Penicillium ucsense]
MSDDSHDPDQWPEEVYVEAFPASRGPRVQAVNVERKDQRFSVKHDLLEPAVANWRSNLAASSQRRNLLFVAYNCEVHVWIPSGPLQVLGGQAEMIIHPAMKDPLADGYIDPDNPHAINSILVDELGRDEVLLIATDSGNVCGYHVESIFSAVKRAAESGQDRPFDSTGVVPFFVENAGMSAWGLATHKFARLIAVSANNRHITVYAFALDDPLAEDVDDVASYPDSDGMNSTHADNTWISIQDGHQLEELKRYMPRHFRSRNLRLTYRGHFANIPHVSFANFDLDSNGLWMVSIDISGHILVWRIWDDLGPYHVYSSDFSGDLFHDPRQMGWMVFPLDPRTFKKHAVKEDACGCEPGALVVSDKTNLDVSSSVKHVLDASQSCSHGPLVARPLGDRIDCLPDDLFSNSTWILTSERPHEGYYVSRQSSFDSKDDNISADIRHKDKLPIASLLEVDDEPPPAPSQFHLRFLEDLEAFSESTLCTLMKRPVHPVRQPEFFPTIHFPAHDIGLAPYPINSDYQVLCRKPLYQRFRDRRDDRIAGAYDRFNMGKYLPDMGLVVAASQKGRVAIISLTWQEEIGYAFRLDHILPLATQEKHSERPRGPLLGMAVSPMPGFELPPDVPTIPRGVDPNDWVQFNHCTVNPVDDSSSLPISPKLPGFEHPVDMGVVPPKTKPHTTDSGDVRSQASELASPLSDLELEVEEEHKGSRSNVLNSASGHEDFTLPELHASASASYYPEQRWHGNHPSRHYRLMLFFRDHTVMTYEFWHTWRSDPNVVGPKVDDPDA